MSTETRNPVWHKMKTEIMRCFNATSGILLATKKRPVPNRINQFLKTLETRFFNNFPPKSHFGTPLQQKNKIDNLVPVTSGVKTKKCYVPKNNAGLSKRILTTKKCILGGVLTQSYMKHTSNLKLVVERIVFGASRGCKFTHALKTQIINVVFTLIFKLRQITLTLITENFKSVFAPKFQCFSSILNSYPLNSVMRGKNKKERKE